MAGFLYPLPLIPRHGVCGRFRMEGPMMSDAPETPQGETEETPAESVSKDTDWKAEARKWEARAKANKDAAEKLQQLEESQKSEVQKATERAEAAERALAEKEAEALRLTIAAKHGITGDHLELLSGRDETELEARALKIASLIKRDEKKGAFGPYVPGEGGTPSGSLISTADKFAAVFKDRI